MIAILTVIFVVGYAMIALEHAIYINKSATALVIGALSWTLYAMASEDQGQVSEQLTSHLGELSGILFFLMGAMTIVELIDVHDGFQLITEKIREKNKRKLLWIVGLITFLLSPVMDNLTTTVVMMALIRKWVPLREDRLVYAGMIVIAANAGGAWSPIGDVTTTMLWIGGQLTARNIFSHLILPGIACLVIPMFMLGFRLKGTVAAPEKNAHNENSRQVPRWQQKLVFFSGVMVLLMVPVFRSLTQLPPYIGMLTGLGLLWGMTELMNGRKPELEKSRLSVAHALRKIDSPSILFFLGILLSVDALQSAGILSTIASWLSSRTGNEHVLALSLGLASSVVDNVPLVAASQAMFSLDQFPTDHPFWGLLAFTTGTGGSILVIGSAAGVAAMGMERIQFFWYLKNISWIALCGFLAGTMVYLLQAFLFPG